MPAGLADRPAIFIDRLHASYACILRCGMQVCSMLDFEDPEGCTYVGHTLMKS